MDHSISLRFSWFADIWLQGKRPPLRVLNAIEGPFDPAEGGNKLFASRLPCEVVPFPLSTSSSSGTNPPEAFDALIMAFSPELMADRLDRLKSAAKLLRPGALLCLLLLREGEDSAPPAAKDWTAPLTAEGWQILHCSGHTAPRGSDPAWFSGLAGAMLVAQKAGGEKAQPLPAEDLNFIPRNAQPWALLPAAASEKIPRSVAGRINYLISLTKASSFLDLAADGKSIFANVQAPVKLRLCPATDGEKQLWQEGNSLVIAADLKDFLMDMAEESSAARLFLQAQSVSTQFDLIHINVRHQWREVLRAFRGVLPYTHPGSLFVLNASVPSDPFSALPDKKQALQYRAAAGLSGKHWHGDVYKAVLAIHELYPRYSYCTLMGHNSQTVVWQSGGERKPFFRLTEGYYETGLFRPDGPCRLDDARGSGNAAPPSRQTA